MLIHLVNFTHSLCKFAESNINTAADASGDSQPVRIVYTPAGTARNLWRNHVPEAAAGDGKPSPNTRVGDPFAVLRVYGGPGSVKHPKPTQSFQLKAVGKDDDAAFLLCNAIYEMLAIDQVTGQPLRMLPIAGFAAVDDSDDGQWMIVNTDTTARPGQTGRDERGRAEFTSNFDIGFFKVS